MRQSHVDCLGGAFLVVLSAVLLYQLRGVPYEGWLFPASILILLMTCAALLSVRGGIAILRGKGLDDVFSFFGQASPRIWCIAVGVFLSYTLFAMEVSFLLGTFAVGVFIPMLLSGYKDKKQALVILAFSSGMTLVFYLFFIKILHFTFPTLF